MVPLTLCLWWARYFTRHDWFGTGIHMGVLVMAIVFAMISYQIARATLRGQERITVLQWGMWKDRRLYARIGETAAAACLVLYLSYGGINGVRTQVVQIWPGWFWFVSAPIGATGMGEKGHFDVRIWMPKVLTRRCLVAGSGSDRSRSPRC